MEHLQSAPWSLRPQRVPQGDSAAYAVTPLRQPAGTDEGAGDREKRVAGGTPQTVGNALLNQVTGYAFHNLSQLTFESLLGDPNQLAANPWGRASGCFHRT